MQLVVIDVMYSAVTQLCNVMLPAMVMSVCVSVSVQDPPPSLLSDAV